MIRWLFSETLSVLLASGVEACWMPAGTCRSVFTVVATTAGIQQPSTTSADRRQAKSNTNRRSQSALKRLLIGEEQLSRRSYRWVKTALRTLRYIRGPEDNVPRHTGVSISRRAGIDRLRALDLLSFLMHRTVRSHMV